MIPLRERNCTPLQKGDPPLNNKQIAALKVQLLTDWKVEGTTILKKSFEFERFRRALAFVQEIGILADQQNHHPDICIRYTRVDIELTTHDVNGLSENDFIMAAKIEDL